MKVKTMIGVAVASALTWSYGAAASGNEHTRDRDSSFGVVTPFSPNEAGPAALPSLEHDRLADASFGDADATSAGITVPHEVVTPLASNEAGPNEVHAQRRTPSFDLAGESHGMANPQTPWSPHEAGLNTYAEDMHERDQQIAAVEQARLAASEWNAHLAAGAAAQVGDATGNTSGMALEGSSELRSDAGLPSEVDRTSAMRSESEHAIPITRYDTVGILEVPAEPTEHTVWSVEPLNPNADLARGDTVYLAPDGSHAVVVQHFDNSSPLGASGDQAAGMTERDGETLAL